MKQRVVDIAFGVGSHVRRKKLREFFDGLPVALVMSSTNSAMEKIVRSTGLDAVFVALEGAFEGVIDLAAKYGLEVEVLFRPQGEDKFYRGRVRFGTHKKVLKVLGRVGDWWEIRPARLDFHDRYRKILNRIGDALVDLDANDTIRWANAACLSICGEDPGGKSLEAIIDAQDVARLRTLRQQHSSGVVVPFPVKLINGQTVELDPIPRFGERGEILGTFLVLRQVSRKSGELERARELFTLYSAATIISQAPSLRQALRGVVEDLLSSLDLRAGGVVMEGEEEVYLVQGDPLPSHLMDSILEWVVSVGEEKKAMVLKDVGAQGDGMDFWSECGLGGAVSVPIRSGDKRLGILWFVSVRRGDFSRETVSLLISVAAHMATAVENARNLELRLKEESQRRQFYRDALRAVTRGKLILCDLEELESAWNLCEQKLAYLKVEQTSDVPKARDLVEQILKGEGFPDERCYDMALCTSEAVANVIKHAEKGDLEVGIADDLVRIKISDQGPGIDFAQLPKAVLSPGYSTAPSLGMGYSILLELVDCLYMSTGPQGTVLLMEVSQQQADPLDAFAGLLERDF